MEEEDSPPPVAGDEVPEVPVEAEIEVVEDTAVVENTVDPESTTEEIETDAVVNEESGAEAIVDGDGEILIETTVDAEGDAVETSGDELNVSADDVNISSSDAELVMSPVVHRKPHVTKDVVTGMRIAMGYDDVSQFKTDGFDMSCCVLSEGGLETEKEEMWKFHIMSMTASLSSVQAAASAAMAADNASSSSSMKPKDDEAAIATSADEGEEVVATADGEDAVVADADAAVKVDEGAVSTVTTSLLLAVEDVIWVSTNKASGEPPVLPEGYTLLSDTDLLASSLSAEELAGCADSVYLAVRMGPTPRIAGIRMYCAPALTTTIASAETATEEGGETVTPSTLVTMEALLAGCFPNREVVYRAAPPAIEALQQGPCGLLLEYISESALLEGQQDEDAEDTAAMFGRGSEGLNVVGSSSSKMMMSAAAGGPEDLDEATSGITTGIDISSDVRDNPAFDGSFVGDVDIEMMGGVPVTIADEEGDEDAYASQRKSAEMAKNKREGRQRRTEDDLVADLEARYQAFDTERTHILAQNSELQKRAAALIAREKANIQSKNAASGLGTAATGTAGNIASDEQAQSSTANDLQTAADAESEKEKLYVDTLQKIVNGRVKLERQQSEFDQLSLDLQTRLDDKEFKAGEIKESFRHFKKEIMSKAENSRTGSKLPKNIMDAFESAEQGREDALEKVRLRNISLRTTLKKLERTFRAREQLADGLHMIDFEQLKIENQTLHEKIEERNEELAKLKRKKTVTVQVLTHVREKLRFYEKNNKATQTELNGLETETMKLRAEVSSAKKTRDALRDDNKDLKLKQGFASNDLLISDFEKRKRTIYIFKDKIRDLQERYRALSAQVVTYDPSMPPKGSTGASQLHSTQGSNKGQQPYPPVPGKM